MDQGNSRENGVPAAAKPATWVGHGGAAAFDLRSDTQTTPTAAMLAAISVTTLDDDVYNEDKTTIDLEAHVAALAGKEAALFVLSGTMGNQLALRSLLIQPPHSVLCDHRSHIIRHEAGGVASLSQAMVEAVVPRNGVHLTLEDVKEHACIGDNVHDCPTRVISLENTLGGMIIPLDEVRRISGWAREHGIRMHCDGARLWEVVASGGGSLREFAECFDTVNLCFSKGLGAPVGSIIVGPKDVLKHSRWMRKAIGGGLRQSGVVTAAARVAVDVTFGAGPSGEGGLLKESHVTAKRVEKLWSEMGGKMLYPVHTNMLWLDLESMGCSGDRFTELGAQQGLKLSGNRIITHYQVGEEAIQKLAEVFKQVAAERNAPPKLGPKHANDTGVHVYKV
ncbi:threonine aldolase [Apiospora hydei]|uniref:Threonine aldolase n=1 Tax=Apiospora hydei TaxID=1337664 RepID=A0ABR1X109_9PEZI